jgi:hypothetical protein
VGFALLVAAGGAAGGVGALTGMRAVYRYGLTRGTRALDTLLATVAAKAEGGWGITAQLQRGGDP